MTAGHAEWQNHVRSRRIKIAAGRDDDPLIRNHEGTVKLREFLYCPAKIWVSDLSRLFRVSRQWVKNQRTGACQHSISVTKSEEGANAPALPSFTGDLNGQFDCGFQVF